MKSRLLFPVSVAIISVSTHVLADDAGTLPSISVIASPIIESNKVDDYSGFTTRVSDDQIKDLGALDLAASLRMTPGVQISRYNEVGSYSGDQGGNVYIRGLGASRPGGEIKTYLDGIPVYMGLWNHPLMDLLPLNGVKSIDVIKGPQNQFAGNNFSAVNLLSKSASQEGTSAAVNVSAGSFSTKTLQANLVGQKDTLSYSFAAGEIQSNGDRQNADGKLGNAMGRLAAKVSDAWTVGANFLFVSNKVGDPGDNRYPISNAPVGPYSFSNGVARNDSATNLFGIFAQHEHGDWKGEIKVYQNNGHNNLTNDANWGTFDSSFKMSGVRWKEEFSPWANGKFTGGIDQESVSGSITGPHVGSPVGTPFGFGVAGSATIPTFAVTSAFAGISHNFDISNGWIMQPSVGFRTYSSNRYASKTSPNAGISFISDRTTVYANYTNGILYPGAETYTLTRAIPMAFAAVNGWDTLAPTEDKHTEIGVKFDASEATHIDVSAFQDKITNRYIWSGFMAGAFAPPASGVWSNSFPAYSVSGVEASIRQEITRNWSVFGGLTSLHSSLNNLPYAPSTALSLGVNGEISGFRLAFDAQHQSSMYSLTQDRGAFTPNQVGSFTVANTKVSYPTTSLGKGGEIYLAVNNLLGANYQYNAGYPMPGRNFRVGLVAGF
jgi:iron complex outermembrane receptor protein